MTAIFAFYAAALLSALHFDSSDSQKHGLDSRQQRKSLIYINALS